MAERKIALLTDSTCDLTDEELKENGIRMVPMRIVYEDREYRDRRDIILSQVLDGLDTEVPHSSLPLPEDVMDCLTGIIAEGYTDVLYICVSSQLSGTFQMMRMLETQYPDLRFHGIDSRSMSMGVGFLALEAAKALKKSSDLSMIIKRLEKMREETRTFFAMPTLKYLRLGGRIGAVAAVLGTTLNLKPLITISPEGRFVTAAKVRGFQNAVTRMEQAAVRHFGRRPIHLAVAHADAPEAAQSLSDRLHQALNVVQSHLRQISPVLGVHSGPGLLGIVAYPELA